MKKRMMLLLSFAMLFLLAACGTTGEKILPVRTENGVEIFQLMEPGNEEQEHNFDEVTMPLYTFDIYDVLVIDGKSVKVLAIGDMNGTIQINGGKGEKNGYNFLPLESGQSGLYCVDKS